MSLQWVFKKLWEPPSDWMTTYRPSLHLRRVQELTRTLWLLVHAADAFHATRMPSWCYACCGNAQLMLCMLGDAGLLMFCLLRGSPVDVVHAEGCIADVIHAALMPCWCYACWGCPAGIVHAAGMHYWCYACCVDAVLMLCMLGDALAADVVLLWGCPVDVVHASEIAGWCWALWGMPCWCCAYCREALLMFCMLLWRSADVALAEKACVSCKYLYRARGSFTVKGWS